MISLNHNVLVLNRLWQAVNLCTVRRAMCLLYQEHAQVVFEDNGNFSTYNFIDWCGFSTDVNDGDDYIHTTCYSILAPKIILLVSYDKTPYKEVKLTRQNIFERDNNTCQYCGKKFDRKNLNIDHIIPRDKGGSTSWKNLVCSCLKCNSRKANMTLKQAGMKLIRKPKKPMWRPFLAFNLGKLHQSWRHFIDISYWKVQLGEESDEAMEEHFDKFAFTN